MLTATLITLVSSSVTLGCPDLTGRYPICRSTTGETSGAKDMVVSQASERGVTTYTFTSQDEYSNDIRTEVLRADGKPVVTTETRGGREFKSSITVTCTLRKVKVTTLVTRDGKPIINTDMKIWKKDHQLHHHLIGVAGGGPINDEIICE